MGLCLHALHPVRSNPWVLSTYMYVIMLWGVLSVDVLLLEWWSLVYSVWGAGCQIVLPLSAGGSIVMRVCEFALPIISFCWFKWIWRCIVCLILGTPTLTRDCFSDWLSQPSNIKMLLFHAVNLMPDRDPRLHFHWTYCATIQHLLSRDFTDTHIYQVCIWRNLMHRWIPAERWYFPAALYSHFHNREIMSSDTDRIVENFVCLSRISSASFSQTDSDPHRHVCQQHRPGQRHQHGE